jgi:hypothetical protein
VGAATATARSKPACAASLVAWRKRWPSAVTTA